MFRCQREYNEERLMNKRVREEDITMLMLIDKLDMIIDSLDRLRKATENKDSTDFE